MNGWMDRWDKARKKKLVLIVNLYVRVIFFMK